MTSLSFAVSLDHELCSKLKMANDMTAVVKKGSPRKSFTPAEDVLLSRLVMIHGSDNWETVACFMSGRNARQCRERWRTVLTPGLINGPWSHAEDELLVRLYREHGPKWSLISKHFNGRSDSNVKNRWTRHLMLMNLDHIEKKEKSEQTLEQQPEIPRAEVVSTGPDGTFDDPHFWFAFEDQLDNCFDESFINW